MVIGAWLESIWGSGAFALFCFVVNVVALSGVYVETLMLYVVTRQSTFMYVKLLQSLYMILHPALVKKQY